jgi:hypothetical protein
MVSFPNSKFIFALLIASLLACTTPPKTVPDSGSAVAEFPTTLVGNTRVSLHHHHEHATAKLAYKVTSVEADGSFDLRQKNRDKKRIFIDFDSTAIRTPMIKGIQHNPSNVKNLIEFTNINWITGIFMRSTNRIYI